MSRLKRADDVAAQVAQVDTDVAMYTLGDLQRSLGKSRRQLRERMDALAREDGLLDGQVHTGSHGRKEYSAAVLEMVKEMDALSGNLGLSIGQSAREVAAKIKGNGHRKRDPNEGQDRGREVQLDG